MSTVRELDDVGKRALSQEDCDYLFRELEELRDLNLLDDAQLDAARARYELVGKKPFARALFLSLFILSLIAFLFGTATIVIEYWDYLFARGELVLVWPFIAAYVVFFASRYFHWELTEETSLFLGSSLFALCAVYIFGPDSTGRAFTLAAFAAGLLSFFSSKLTTVLPAVVYIGASIVVYVSDRSYDRLDALFLIALGFYWSWRRRSTLAGTLYYALFILWGICYTLRLAFFETNNSVFCLIALCSLYAYLGRRLELARLVAPWFARVVYALSLLPALVQAINYQESFFQNDRATARGVVFTLIVVAFVFLGTLYDLIRDARAQKQNALKLVDSFIWRFLEPETIAVALLPIYAPSLLFSTGLASSSDVSFSFFYGNLIFFLVATRLVVVGARRNNYQYWVGFASVLMWGWFSFIKYSAEFGVFGAACAALFFAIFLIAAATLTKKFVKPQTESESRAYSQPLEPRDVLPKRLADLALVVVVLVQIGVGIYALTLR